MLLPYNNPTFFLDYLENYKRKEKKKKKSLFRNAFGKDVTLEDRSRISGRKVVGIVKRESQKGNRYYATSTV